MVNEELSGVVRKLRDGYGFIAGNDGTDYFLHWTAMAQDGPTFRELKVGNRVVFQPFKAPKGLRATEVRVIS
jgi:CspA family cold shock protein